MTPCVFCDVVRGSAPASIVYEEESVLAFLDLYPVNRGHTLVIPKEHIVDLSSCPEALASRLFAASARLAPTIVAVTGAEGYNIWTANGRTAGQTVFHLHLHILPRFPDDTFGLRFPEGYPRQANRDALDALAGAIRATRGPGGRGSSSRD